jgi:uncharacterized iron-regulated membrane protein
MNTSHAIQRIRIGVFITFIAILFMVWGGIVYSARAEDQINLKNDIQTAVQAVDIGSFSIQAPDSTSKNYSGNNVPMGTTGAAFSTEPGPLSKNSAGNSQP